MLLHISNMKRYAKAETRDNIRQLELGYAYILHDRVSDVGQIEIHTAEPIVPDPSSFEVETATAKLKMYK
jgi:hypothetical protein